MEGESTDNPKIETEERAVPEAKILELPVEVEAPDTAPQEVEEDRVAAAELRPPAPKKKGRPKGAADKKPRPPRKRVVVQEESVEEQEEELPRALPGSLPIPTEPTTDKAALMLELLQRQAHARKNAKAQLWKSWFH